MIYKYIYIFAVVFNVIKNIYIKCTNLLAQIIAYKAHDCLKLIIYDNEFP